VVTFALSLESMAVAFARLEHIDGGQAVAAAMRAHPELIRGGDAVDTKVMRTLPGWTAKGGAEGLLCATGPDGLGLVLKVEDGNGRALQPALGVFLTELGLRDEGFGPLEVHNSRGEVVGDVIALEKCEKNFLHRPVDCC
jgi:L-asparaginase II